MIVKSKVEFRAVLSLIIVTSSFAFLFAMLFVRVPKENEALINVVCGAVLVGGVGAIIGFYFGSSKSEIEKPATKGTIENPLEVNTTITNDQQ